MLVHQYKIEMRSQSYVRARAVHLHRVTVLESYGNAVSPLTAAAADAAMRYINYSTRVVCCSCPSAPALISYQDSWVEVLVDAQENIRDYT